MYVRVGEDSILTKDGQGRARKIFVKEVALELGLEK